MKIDISRKAYVLLASVAVILALVGISYNKINDTNTKITGQTNKATSTLSCVKPGCNYWNGRYFSTDDSLGDIDVNYCSSYSGYKNFSTLDCQGTNKCQSYDNTQNCNLTMASGWNDLRENRDSCITKCYLPYQNKLKECDRSADSEDLSCGEGEMQASCSCINNCLADFAQGCQK